MTELENLKSGDVVAIGRRVGRDRIESVLRLETVKRLTPTQIICTSHGNLTAEDRYKKSSGQAVNGLSSIMRIATDDDRARVTAKTRQAAETKAAMDSDYEKRKALRLSFPEGWQPSISSASATGEYEVSFTLTQAQIGSLAQILWKVRSIPQDETSNIGAA
jgi:hypothetical protein